MVDVLDADAPFVGRERELETLAGSLRDARTGRTRFVLLTGEAGVGKTRTVEELVRQADLPSGRVLWGRAPEHTGAPSYWPWIRAVEAYGTRAEPAALREQLGADAPVLAHLVPALRKRCPDVEPVPPGGSDAEARFQLLDAMTSFLRRAAADDPLVLVLEDLHWADEATLALLAFVAGELRTARALLVATCREHDARRRPRGLADVVRLAQRVPLRGLGRTAVEAIVARASDGAPAPELVARLHDLTDGNPFYLGELLRVLRDEGRLDAPVNGSPVALPPSVRDTLRHRLDPLVDEDRALLALAAVSGREFDVALLQRALDTTAEAILARLTAATELGLVEETATVGRFRFVHALVHETVYGDLLPAARARLHRRVAEALEARHAGDSDPPLGELAAHYVRAAPLGTAEKAVECSIRAAEQAVALCAYGDAIAHYERAVAALALQAPDERKRLEVSLALGAVAVKAARYPQARHAFDQAARRARALGDTQSFILAALSYAEASPPSGAPEPLLIALLEEALVATGDGDGPIRALTLAMLAQALYFADLDRSRETSAEALAMARRVGDAITLSLALLYRQVVLSGPGDVAERLALVDEAIAVATDVGFEPAIHHGNVARAFCLLESGCIGDAAAAIDRMRQDAEATRLPDRQWRALVHRAGLAIMEGRFAEGARQAAEALAIRRDASDPTAVRLFTMQTYLCRRETGDLGSLEGTIRSLAAAGAAFGVWRCLLAALLVDSGRLEEARTILEVLAADEFGGLRRDFYYPPCLALLAGVTSVLGDAARAPALYRLLLPFASRNVVLPVYAPGALGSAQHFLGVLAATEGDATRAATHFEAALAENARLGARPALARTQYEYARLLHARGDTGRAAGLRAAALELAEGCGMTRLLDQLMALDVAQRPAPAGHVAAVGTGQAVLRREADFWVVGYGPQAFQLKDTKGLALLQTLLRHPGREFHVLDLAGGGEPAVEGGGRAAAGDAGELLDPAARAAYKRRLDDLRDALEEARSFNDLERAARAEQEIDFLTDELARAVGLGGRSRTAASATERARVNVSRTIGAVVKKIVGQSPALGQHLQAAVRTGYFCSYSPDPRVPIAWRF